MIITKTWIQEFLDISKLDISDICKTFNSIGLEVDSLNQIRIPLGVVVGYVTDKQKHPDADKLSVCQVNIGEETVQIVCGATNVKEGQYIPVATVGCTLGKDFKIKKAKLRGVDSNGMICSSSEIGLPKLSDGILVLDNSIGDLIIGKELNEYKLLNDDVVELELTANRGDCLSIHGIARELSAYYNISMYEKEVTTEYNDIGIGQVLEVECDNDLSSSLIFKVIDIVDFKLPILYKIRNAIISQYKDNDIANVIAYSTHENGVILNAYAKDETDKHNNLSLLRIKKDDDGFDCIYGKKHLSTICIDHKELNTSNNIMFIEASYINPEELSKNVFEKKKKTAEVYYQSSRGSEPYISEGLDSFTTFISKLGAKVFKGAKTLVEEIHEETLDISTKKINSIIGQNVSKIKIEKILSNLGFKVKDGGNGVLSIQIPAFRHDIKNIADVTEEIVRTIGIDNIKSKPLAIDEVNRTNKTSQDLIKKNKFRFKSIENGFFETITYVFSNKQILEKYNFPLVNEKLDILNPIVSELNTYRTTLLLNLVEAVSNNFKQGFKKVALFEIGTVFNTKREESKKISFIFSGDKEGESFTNQGKPQVIDFFTFSTKILNTIGKFEIKKMKKITNDFIHPYQNADISINKKTVGYIAKLHPSVTSDFNMADTFIAEIDFDLIPNDLVVSKYYSKFQASKKDLSIVVPKNIEYRDIKKVIDSISDENIKQYNLIDIYSDEKLGDSDSLTIRFVLQNNEKTLSESDITTSMSKILKTLDEKLGLNLR